MDALGSPPAQAPAKGFTELVREGCEGYVLQGIGLPIPAYVFHGLKLALFVLGWAFFVSFTPGLRMTAIASWWLEPIAFQKAFVWACLVEVAGLGCMSGPLGCRIWPPFTASSTSSVRGRSSSPPSPACRSSAARRARGSTSRSTPDSSSSLLRALVAPAIGTLELLPIVVLLPICGLTDKTILLAARVEHHFAMIVCFLLAGNWIAAAKIVQLAIWFWAGVSKLTVAFGYVIPVMTVNNPLVRSARVRRGMFVSYPDDLRPSRLGKAMAHAGTFLELAAPLTLLFVTGPGPLQVAGIVLVLMLHGFILGNMPAGSVFEWNLVSLYAAFFLFVGYPEVSPLELGSTPLALYLFVNCFVLPLVGNFVPSKVSFLVAMRYYAGNWAWSGWLFRGDSVKKLDRVKRASPLFRDQLERFAPAEAANMTCRGLAFRSLHLQGRALGALLPKAVGDHPFEAYSYVDGENVAGSVLGWNFGEGHLCQEQLLACVQEQCDFDEGELRAIMVESQPLFGSTAPLARRRREARRAGRGIRLARRACPPRPVGLRRQPPEEVNHA